MQRKNTVAQSHNGSKRQFLGVTGKVGLSTFAASAAGINLGLIDLVHAQNKSVQPFRFAMISDSHLFSHKNHNVLVKPKPVVFIFQ